MMSVRQITGRRVECIHDTRNSSEAKGKGTRTGVHRSIDRSIDRVLSTVESGIDSLVASHGLKMTSPHLHFQLRGL